MDTGSVHDALKGLFVVEKRLLKNVFKKKTNVLKKAYTQICPGASLPENQNELEDVFFDNLPKMCTMIINPNNVVTDFTVLWLQIP